MTNSFLSEFTREVGIGEFQKWLLTNSKIFRDNMFILGIDMDKKELREWIYLFLRWSEYEDNKLDGDQN